MAWLYRVCPLSKIVYITLFAFYFSTAFVVIVVVGNLVRLPLYLCACLSLSACACVEQLKRRWINSQANAVSVERKFRIKWKSQRARSWWTALLFLLRVWMRSCAFNKFCIFALCRWVRWDFVFYKAVEFWAARGIWPLFVEFNLCLITEKLSPE